MRCPLFSSKKTSKVTIGNSVFTIHDSSDLLTDSVQSGPWRKNPFLVAFEFHILQLYPPWLYFGAECVSLSKYSTMTTIPGILSSNKQGRDRHPCWCAY